ncbi:MAG: glycogen synthase [Thermoflexus sp.]|uniref:glycogen synthase n=1 Tax=Thermoflexus sp. TaxID=1969742 RepID=UPI0025E0D188|nr:glycogen synthase [Thermoflexus sp.]MCS6965058.1 glycogen synthase [Thermoflexus sp.]MDW8185303.1 glycogen synthase [Anaerolineae bacterium]
MRILYVVAEAAPFAKVGGLADVAYGLPRALRALGHDVRVILPRYRAIDGSAYGLRPLRPPFPVPVGLTGEARMVEAEISEATGVPTYFIWDEHYFGRDEVYGYPDDPQRFVFFCRAVLAFIHHFDERPDVLHGNDWHTGFLFLWLATAGRRDRFYRPIATVFTIHNMAYQGITGDALLAFGGIHEHVGRLEVEPPGHVNWLARGIAHADAVNTVSPRYAQEILTPEFGFGLEPLLQRRADRLFGILNGLDPEAWDPRSDPALAACFDAGTLERRAENKRAAQQAFGLPLREEIPLLAFVGRLIEQKGADLLLETADALFAREVQVAVLGTGMPEYEAAFAEWPSRFPGQAGVQLAFDENLARLLYGGADVFLMPSKFEPCGLGQMIAMRYGALPLVHAVGGLADTVRDVTQEDGTGFVFTPFAGEAFLATLDRALALYRNPAAWRAVQRRAMAQDFSWAASARAYEDLYRRAIAWHNP